MLELEREAAATTTKSTPEAVYLILITQQAPFSRKGLIITCFCVDSEKTGAKVVSS